MTEKEFRILLSRYAELYGKAMKTAYASNLRMQLDKMEMEIVEIKLREEKP